eukprot:PhF_6_TR27336/c0_g1_i1/m.40168
MSSPLPCHHNTWLRRVPLIPTPEVHLTCKLCLKDIVFDSEPACDAAVPAKYIVGTVDEEPKCIVHLRNVPQSLTSEDVQDILLGQGWATVHVTMIPERRQALAQFKQSQDAAVAVSRESVRTSTGWPIYVSFARKQGALLAKTLFLTMNRTQCGDRG